MVIAKHRLLGETDLLANPKTSFFAPYLLDGVEGASPGSFLGFIIGSPSTYSNQLSQSDELEGVIYCTIGFGRRVGEACPFTVDEAALRKQSFHVSLINYLLLPAIDVLPGLDELVTSEFDGLEPSIDFGNCGEDDIPACVDVMWDVGKTLVEAALQTPAGQVWLVQHGLTAARVLSIYLAEAVFNVSFNLTGLVLTYVDAEKTQVLRSPPFQSGSIVVTPASPSFNASSGGAVPPSVGLAVTNGGSGTLSGLSLGAISYGQGETTGWLGTASLSGSTAPTTLTLRPSTTNLSPGTYHATLSISATGNVQNSPLDLAITYTISQPSPLGEIANGETRAGAIIGAGQTDTYSFGANQGDAIVVSIGAVAPTVGFSPWIRVYSPSGTLLRFGIGDAAAELETTAPSTGTYTVVVGSADIGNDGTGDYLLTLVKTPGPYTVSPGDQGGPLTNGATHSGHIYVGDSDAWTFPANQGDAIVVSIGAVAPTVGFSPWIRVYSPSGILLRFGIGDAAAELETTAPSTGTYTVVVGSADIGNDGTGDYLLTLVKTPGPYTVSPGDQGGPLTNGATDSGHIYVGDSDAWTFPANQGDAIVVSIGAVAPTVGFSPWIRVYSPSGTLLRFGIGDAAAELETTAPSTGTYTVVVGSADIGNDGTGDYLLTLVKTPGPYTVSPGDQGGPLTNGATHSGHIYVGDSDAWTFPANQGDAIVVSIGAVAPTVGFSPWIRVYSPSGILLRFGIGDAAAELETTAPSTGTYTVVVGSADVGNDGTGNYLLTLAVTGASGGPGAKYPAAGRPDDLMPHPVSSWSSYSTFVTRCALGQRRHPPASRDCRKSSEAVAGRM